MKKALVIGGIILLAFFSCAKNEPQLEKSHPESPEQVERQMQEFLLEFEEFKTDFFGFQPVTRSSDYIHSEPWVETIIGEKRIPWWRWVIIGVADVVGIAVGGPYAPAVGGLASGLAGWGYNQFGGKGYQQEDLFCKDLNYLAWAGSSGLNYASLTTAGKDLTSSFQHSIITRKCAS